jgi:hypothetical protein
MQLELSTTTYNVSTIVLRSVTLLITVSLYWLTKPGSCPSELIHFGTKGLTLGARQKYSNQNISREIIGVFWWLKNF